MGSGLRSGAGGGEHVLDVGFVDGDSAREAAELERGLAGLDGGAEVGGVVVVDSGFGEGSEVGEDLGEGVDRAGEVDCGGEADGDV